MMNVLKRILFCELMIALAATSAIAQVNVLTYHNDNGRTGQNLGETNLTPANVNTNSFGKLFTTAVDGYVYAQPLYVSGIFIPGKGTHNMVFISTEHNSVYAFDADSNTGAGGGLLWQANMGPSAATPNTAFGNRYGAYSDIIPEVDVTGTSVIDLAAGIIYVDAFTHEGANYIHRIHALNITNGMEMPFSPVVVTASVPGQGVDSVAGVVRFNATQELQRPALTLAGGGLYVAYAGYADTDPYHGWVIGFDAHTLQPLTNRVFNTSPNSTVAAFGENAGEGGIWMSGNGLAVDSATNLFFMTGNGSFDATNGLGGTEYGDSFIKLSTLAGLAVSDFFTPSNQDYMAAGDHDLGSGGLLLLPDSVGTSDHPHLLAGTDKQGTLFLLDRDNLGRYDATNDSVVQEFSGANNGTWSSAAYFNNRLYVLGSGYSGSDYLRSFLITNGTIQTTPLSLSPTPYGFPGATPSISANGTNDAIVWALQTDGSKNASPATLHAYDAYDLSYELYNSDQAGTYDMPGGAVKFTVPTVANGKVYVGSAYSFSVYGLTSLPTIVTQPTNVSALIGADVQFTVEVTGSAPLQYQWYFNGKAVSKATNEVLDFPSVQIASSGTYRVQISNSVGSVTSSNAVLTVRPPDLARPVVKVSSPIPGQQTTNASFIAMGTAKDNVQLANVFYQLNDAGWNPLASSSKLFSWTAGLSLNAGTNVFQVYAVDAGGNYSLTNTINVVYVLTAPLTVQTSGIGTVSPNLNGKILQIGSAYKMSAKPGSGYVFSGWTGVTSGSNTVITSDSTTLNFVMQSNLVLTAGFIPNPFIPVSGVYQGLFYETNGIAFQSSGAFSAKVSSSGKFSAKLQMGSANTSLSGQFSGTGYWSNSIPRRGLSPLSVQLQLDLTTNNAIVGEISSGADWTASLNSYLGGFSKSVSAPQAGKYTLVIPAGSFSATVPGGNGFGALTVDGLGNVTMKGYLGDGTVASEKAVLSGGGQWPFYISLYSGNGSILGWLTFTNDPVDPISGSLTWTKLAQTRSKLYPAGFTNSSPIQASAYGYTNGVPILNFTSGQVGLEIGNLPVSFTNQIIVATNGKITSTNKTALTIATSSGVFKGKVINPSGKPVSVSGVVLQNQSAGYGVFLGTNQTGQVFFGH